MADPRIKEPGEGGGLGTVRYLRSEDCYDSGPSHIPYAFVVEVENKIHIVNIACCLQLIKCVLWSQNIKKYTLKNFQMGGCVDWDYGGYLFC